MGDRIRFTNLIDRERTALATLQSERDRLEARRAKRGDLSDIERAELERIKALLAREKAGAYIDPLFAGIRYALANDDDLGAMSVEHSAKGELDFGEVDAAARRRLQTRVALILGLIELDDVPLPQLVATTRDEVEPDRADPAWRRLSQGFYVALGEVKANFDLALKVLPILAKEGDEPGDGVAGVVSTLEFAKVMRALVRRGVTPNEPQLRRRVNESLDNVQDVGEERPLHEIGFELPDLEDVAFDNLKDAKQRVDCAGSALFTAMFVELKAFQVVDTLVDMSRVGALALDPGPAATQLYKYWRDAPNRVSEIERQGFLSQMIGVPGGPPDAPRNVDFQDYWNRFVAATCSLVREERVDRLLRANTPGSVSQQVVRKSARDLVTCISANAHGMAHYIALDLQQQLREMIALLGSREVMATCGATNLWDVISYYAETQLGGARNSAKYGTLATSGAIIAKWLANNLHRLTRPSALMIDLNEVQNPPPRRSGERATTHPSDYDLVNACELWNADMLIGEGESERLAENLRDAPDNPTRPIPIPAIARDLLDQAGLGLGLGIERQRVRSNGYAAY